MRDPIRFLITASAFALLLSCVGCDKATTDAPEPATATPTDSKDPSATKPADSKDPSAAATTTAPKAQEPIQGDPGDWCGGHALPESMCTKCNPELAAGFKAKGDWCEAHGFPESACPTCNPMQAPAAN